jgi:hypothetical protein
LFRIDSRWWCDVCVAKKPCTFEQEIWNSYANLSSLFYLLSKRIRQGQKEV